MNKKPESIWTLQNIATLIVIVSFACGIIGTYYTYKSITDSNRQYIIQLQNDFGTYKKDTDREINRLENRIIVLETKSGIPQNFNTKSGVKNVK